MFNIGTNQIVKSIGNVLFLIFIFILFVDPTNSILHKKDIIFVILVTYCLLFFKPDLSKLPFIGALLIAILVPYLISIISMRNIDFEDSMAVFKSIAPSVLLLWIREFDLIRLSRLPVILTCIIMDLLFLCIIIIPETESVIYLFASVETETIIMAQRWFLGVKFFCMYLKSTIAMIFCLSYFIYKCFSKGKHSVGSYLALAVIFFYFMFSGTRSSMLVPFFLIGMTIYATFRDSTKAKLFFYPILFIGGILFITLILTLVFDTQEASNVVKYGHLTSYLTLFENNPSYLLIGQGPGASFYTEGFDQTVLLTEWTYLELIRMLGVFSILVVIVFVWPLFSFWKNRQDTFSFCMSFTYLAYLLIAGTNPLMLSSTGMLVLLFAYSYRESIIKQSQSNEKS